MSLSCTAIYTAPLVLFFSADSASLNSQFTTVSIPMLKTEERDGTPSTQGLARIRDILARRIDVDADVRYGLNRLKSDLLQRISPLGLPEPFGSITVGAALRTTP